MDIKDIAVKAKVGLSTVYTIIKAGYTGKPTPTVETRGRPPKFAERGERAVVRYTLKNRRATLGEITNASPVKAHPNTIRKVLKKNEINSRVARMKPYLMPRHIVNRKVFAKEHLNWTLDQWKEVIWTDESSFELGKPSGKQLVWRKLDEAFNQDCTGSTFKSGRSSVMVWGAIAYGKKSELVVMDKNRRTATDFVDQVYDGPLLQFMTEFIDPILMEDGAPIHRAKVSNDWRDEHELQKLVWPAQSPDLNPIENLWSTMKRAVYKKHRSSDTVDVLIKNIREAWENLSMKEVNTLVESMPNRVKKLSKNKGKGIDY